MLTFYVICKKVEGAYLLDKRNVIWYAGTSESDARTIFNRCVASKQSKDIYVLFSQLNGDKRLNVILER